MADLCYRYNKFSKENLLRNNFLSFAFICFAIRKLQSQSEAGDEDNLGPILISLKNSNKPPTASQLDASMSKHQKERAVLHELLKLVSVI